MVRIPPRWLKPSWFPSDKNMKILKFRVWDEKYRCWDREPITIIPGEPALKQGRVIQQWTGLVDSKGKDIYEGDIVSIVDRYNCEKEHIGAVEYKDGKYIVITDDGFWTFMLDSGDGVKVIGNIFENEELLK